MGRVPHGGLYAASEHGAALPRRKGGHPLEQDTKTVGRRIDDPPVKRGHDGSFLLEDLNGVKVGLLPKPCFEDQGHNVHPYPESPCLITRFDAEDPILLRSEPDVGIHLHLHHPELLEEMIAHLSHMPFAFQLYVSLTERGISQAIKAQLTAKLDKARVDVREFENRGRDIAAFVSGFGYELLRHDYIAHIHTKKSTHNWNKADWRRQLMTYLMGSRDIVLGIFRRFETDPGLGMIFPAYHHSLRQQISWGGNLQACQQLAKRLKITVSPDFLTLFPAGSMYWARSAALKPLLEADLSYEDFPDEAGQVDGTLAHAVERLLGEIVKSQEFRLLQTRCDKPFNLLDYHPKQWPWREPDNAAKLVGAYRKQHGKRNRIAVVTAMAGQYDQPVIHQVLNPRFDYIFYSDGPLNNRGFWQVRPMDWYHPENVRMARRIKTCIHRYLADYDWVVWLDASIVIRCDLNRYIEVLDHPDAPPVGAIPHPLRNCAYEEAHVVIASGRDSTGRVERQMRDYERAGFPKHAGLFETGLLIINMNHEETPKLMRAWWSEINRYSHRDQLSLNFVLWKLKIDCAHLMDEKKSVRDSGEFAFIGHRENSGYEQTKNQPESILIDPYKKPDKLQPTVANIDRTGIDIIICVHDALAETQACLFSVQKARREIDRIIIVDDASGHETASFLRNFSKEFKAVLVRNDPPAHGYCRAANLGMEASQHSYFMLLNSDTVITRSAVENMLSVAVRYPDTGVVGPLSNAASSQSIPEIEGNATQTAINEIPGGRTVEEMNRLCQKWTNPNLIPSVPLVHGFCQVISRSVYEVIGGFDAESFPRGYGEENDFCLRAADAGFDLRIATNAYVYHVKSASYKEDSVRRELMARGGRTLKEKHSPDRVEQSVRMMDEHPLLIRMRTLARELLR